MKREQPTDLGNPQLGWGSDAVAELLRRLKIPYVSLVPGASYRGLHDSIVNYLGNEQPAMLVTLHEEHAVAIAHGYAKVTEKPMAAALHSNVGLMHASMAIFDAWCDRAPVLVLGATGPIAADRRRPWIDWIHTSQDQGSLVRGFTKWDDQPASVPAALESVLRANMLANTAPAGPVYICLDIDLQESELANGVAFPDVARFQPGRPPAPSRETVGAVAAVLSAAKRPLILAGRVSRSEDDWHDRIALAERLNAPVLTDLKVAAAFPTRHPLHVAPPTFFMGGAAAGLLAAADAIVSLDWLDLAGTLNLAKVDIDNARIVHCSYDAYAHKAPGADHQGLAPADITIACPTEALVSDLIAAIDRIGATPPRHVWWTTNETAAEVEVDLHGAITQFDIAEALDRARGNRELCLTQLSLDWPAATCDFGGPLDYLGRDGGAGVGSGPGIAVGIALGLAGSGRIPVAIMGDGDHAMGATAIWSAVHHGLPLVVLIANNRSYMNDERHQERIAETRGRPVANKWIGQRMEDPEIDHAGLARAQGAEGLGPITEPNELETAIGRALDVAERGGVAVVDIHIVRD